MMTDLQYEVWLSRTAERVVLIELHYESGVEYISNKPYTSQPGDSLPNQPFDDILRSVSEVSARIDGVAELADIDLVDDGSITGWVSRKWRGYPVIIRLGDPAWSYDDFRIIARQINDGLQSFSRGLITFGIYDQTTLLDKPINRPEMPNGQQIPFILGQVIGTIATQISTQSLLYQFSWLPVTSLTVRDGNGPEMSHAPDLTNGKFTLSAYTPRNVICDVTEPHTTALSIITWLADHYNIALASGISLPDYMLGLRYDGEVTGRQILDDICRSLGASWKINLLGELDVQQYVLPDPVQPADVQIHAEEIEADQIELRQTDEPLKSLAVRYARNHSVINEVAGSIGDSDLALAERLKTEWLVSKAEQMLSGYPFAPDQTIDTVLVNESDAGTERDRRLLIRSQRRDTWSVTAFLASTKAVIGASASIDHPWLAGRIGRIISTRISPDDERIELEVRY